MENLTKEQAIEKKADDYIKQYLPHVNTTGHWLGFQDGYKQALNESSGSVAAPKPDEPKGQTTNKNYEIGPVTFKEHMALFREFEKQQIELASLRQQLKDRDELIANLKQEIARLIEDVNKAYEH